MLRKLGKQKLTAKLRERNGSSLLEAVASLVLFTMIMVMTATVFSISGKLSMRTQDTDQAINQAMRNAESITYDDRSKTLTFTFVDEDGSSTETDAELAKAEGGGATFWKFVVDEGSTP